MEGLIWLSEVAGCTHFMNSSLVSLSSTHSFHKVRKAQDATSVLRSAQLRRGAISASSEGQRKRERGKERVAQVWPGLIGCPKLRRPDALRGSH